MEKGGSTEYLEDDLDDAVLQSVLKRAYSLFKLFNGSLTRSVPFVLMNGLDALPECLSNREKTRSSLVCPYL